ncbi:MAG: HEAT repeat domain-containing protein [Bryobacteraceae bacterium]|nr:HEAT repeat domain-containing protein [Bryobacteraceae bacterium]
MRIAAVSLCAFLAAAALISRFQPWPQIKGAVMFEPGSAKNDLSRQIASGLTEPAKALARTMPTSDVGEVLQQQAGHEKASARLLVLELASLMHSEGASRAILSRLTDANLTVRSIANSLIATIAQPSLVEELLKALEQNDDLVIKGALAKQIGMIGNPSPLPQLRALHRTTREAGLRHDLSIAMARLGDEQHRQELIQRLGAPTETARMAAIDDVLYTGDATLVRYFRPLLEDRRDAVAISLPHDPVVAARVCDLAIRAMAALNIRLSFSTAPLRRFDEMEIQEALQIMTALESTP